MSEIASLQIGQKKIDVGNKYPLCDFNNLTTVNNTSFEEAIRYGDRTMYVAICTPTEDCYMRFVGNITSEQNLCIIVETKEQTDYYISTQYVNSDYAGWDHYSEIFYAQKGHTYEFRVLGFANARILKYGFK